MLALAGGLVLRAGLLERHGLWADEIFSLATATGHSLEHPAAEADPAWGDFVEPATIVEAGRLRSYLEHSEPAASPARVVRAVLLSDTSPPLYYLLLNLWTRVAGTGDRDLRLLSLLWGIASLPMIWLVARAVAGPTAAATALVLFSFAPIAVFYSTEGRMYSMLWFLSLALAWTTLLLVSRERSTDAALRWSLLWGLIAGAGLLTHYFFAFVWAACASWLWLDAGRRRFVSAVTATASSLLLAASWYWRLPESLGRWRVTGYWLEERLTPAQAWWAPWKLAWSYLSGGVDWKSWGPIASPFPWDRWVGLALVAAAVGVGWSYRSRGRPRCERGVALIWIWIGASLLGPLAFDLWRGTYTSLIPRYAQAGLPALLLLLAVALAWVPLAWRGLLVLALLGAWTPAVASLYSMKSRSGPQYREIAESVSRWAERPGKLVLVQSIPSGLLGIARYSDPGTPLASWIEQLGSKRIPQDLERLLQGRDEVALVEVHTVWAPARPREWLEAHALGTGTIRGARLFAPACDSGFAERCDTRASAE